MYRDECAVRLQAAWRGTLTRRATDPALRHANPRRMRRYCEQRLTGLTDELLGRIDAERSEVDALFAEIDSTVAASRVIMGAEPIDWGHCEEVARERGLGDCPVCLTSLDVAGKDGVVLLSCTHVFHARCLASFERFSIAPVCSCPVCRATYTKQTLMGPGSSGGAGEHGGGSSSAAESGMDVMLRGMSGGAAAGSSSAELRCEECAPEMSATSTAGRSSSRSGGVGGPAAARRAVAQLDRVLAADAGRGRAASGGSSRVAAPMRGSGRGGLRGGSSASSLARDLERLSAIGGPPRGRGRGVSR